VRHAHRLEALRIKLKERMVKKESSLYCGFLGSKAMIKVAYQPSVTQVIVELSQIKIGQILRENQLSLGK
jgi:hypothetical protein